MNTVAEAQVDSVFETATRWPRTLTIAFRFVVTYFALYCLLTQVIQSFFLIPGLEMPDLSTLSPTRQVVLWTAEHVFRYRQPVVFTGSGSGDKVFDWVLSFCLLGVALLAACIWSVLDRHRAQYQTLYNWFRVFIRFAVAGQLFVYGFVKVFPMQMQFPALLQLLERYGSFSPMGVLWYSVGASPSYERFVGSAELLAGLLLIIPATSMLGALVCLIDMIEVFVLNMTYDVPVKLFSFHMIAMAVFLLLPERKRILQFCLSHCAIAASETHRLCASARANRSATALQVVYGLCLCSLTCYGTWHGWSKYVKGAPKSPYYGIWDVEEMSVDGVIRAPLLTDSGRWRRLIFESPDSTSFERMDDSIVGFSTVLDDRQHRLTLTDKGAKQGIGQLTVHRQSGSRLSLDGQMSQHNVHMELNLVERKQFLLVSRGFSWVQDYPFIR